MSNPVEVVRTYCREMLAAQHRGEAFTAEEHQRLIGYVDVGVLGMDGFKYCWPEEAKENRRKMLGAACRKTA